MLVFSLSENAEHSNREFQQQLERRIGLLCSDSQLLSGCIRLLETRSQEQDLQFYIGFQNGRVSWNVEMLKCSNDIDDKLNWKWIIVCELIFDLNREKAGIAPLLDVEDMVMMSRPDWKCVFTYVQSFYRRFKDE